MSDESKKNMFQKVQSVRERPRAFGFRFTDRTPRALNYQAAAAEGLAMFLFVFTCVGTVMNNPSDSQQIAWTFGVTISTLVYSFAHYSGAQINPAVSFALALNDNLSWAQFAANAVAQLVGSTFACGFLALLIEGSEDNGGFGSIGSNLIRAESTTAQAWFGEAIMTALLCIVVLQVAIHPHTEANRAQCAIAIGFAVYICHSVLMSIDGCSVNPARSFGSAIVASIRARKRASPPISSHSIWKNIWVFAIGPFTGSVIAVAFSFVLEYLPTGEQDTNVKVIDTDTISVAA